MKRIRIIAIISAIVTALAVYLYLASLKKPVEIRRAPVVVATVQILEGQEIKPEMVAVKELPEEAVVSNAARSVDEVVGRVSNAVVEPGEQMLVSRFFKAGEDTSGLAYALGRGMRAFTVAVDPVSGVAGLIRPRDSVDVLIIIGVTDETQVTPVPKTYSKVLLQDIKVLAVGQVLVPGGEKKEAGSVDTLTLSVTPDQAVQLNLAASEGKIRLVLRSSIDTDKPNSRPIEVKDLVD